MRVVHRFYDLLVGGAEVVVLNTVKALPAHEHHLVFNNFSNSWITHQLEQLPHVHLHRAGPSDANQVLAALRGDAYFFHFYPPMSDADFRDLPSWVLKRSCIVNHWCQSVPVIPGLRYVFLTTQSKSVFGRQIPASNAAVISNPVGNEFLHLPARPLERFVLGRHSRDALIKFPIDFFDIYEPIDFMQLQVFVLGCPPELSAYVAKNLSRLRHQYWMLGFNTLRPIDFLANIDVYVYKTRDDFQETCPMTVLEAMAAGLPVVVEKKGGIVDLVEDGVTGFLCDSNKEFHTAIEELYRNPTLRCEMSLAAHRWASDNASMRQFAVRIESMLFAVHAAV